METVGAYFAKTHLSKLLDQVNAGERFVITKHGVPVAILQPYDPQKRVDLSAVIAELRQFREGHKLDGLSIREMIAEGRE